VALGPQGVCPGLRLRSAKAGVEDREEVSALSVDGAASEEEEEAEAEDEEAAGASEGAVEGSVDVSDVEGVFEVEAPDPFSGALVALHRTARALGALSRRAAMDFVKEAMLAGIRAIEYVESEQSVVEVVGNVEISARPTASRQNLNVALDISLFSYIQAMHRCRAQCQPKL
jgi:hypothetical protein